MRFTIPNDSGYIGIANTQQYQSFIGKEWTLEQLFSLFNQEIKNNHLILWKTAAPDEANVECSFEIKEQTQMTDFYAEMKVTDGELYFVNYETLTMAAQFAHVTLPEKHLDDLKITLPNGRYLVHVIDQGDNVYGIEFGATQSQARPIAQNIMWQD